MKTHKPVKLAAVFLSVLMLFSVIPMTAFAAWQDDNVVYDGDTIGKDGYYTIVSRKDWNLVPGAATETEMILNNSAGTRRQIVHILECDPSNPDISIIPGYYNIDKDVNDPANQAAVPLTQMAAYYEDELGYNVVGGINTALSYATSAPFACLVYNGQVLADPLDESVHAGKTYLGVYKRPDGTCYCELHETSEGLMGNEWQAVAANFEFVLKDGVPTTTKVSRSGSGVRPIIALKPDGTLVFMENDGRNANGAVGLNGYEVGEMLLALGCQWAIKCDGGGSSTFISKRAGESEFAMRSAPSDGAERPTVHGLFVTSNVGKTGLFENANITSDYDYFAPTSTYTFVAEALDNHGYTMDLPAEATWALSDNTFGTIDDGTFVSNGKTGTVDVQVIYGGEVVGSKTITVDNPATLNLKASSTVIPYSTPEIPRNITIPVVAKTGEFNVYVDGVIDTAIDDPANGILDGLSLTAPTDTSIPGAVVTVTYRPTQTDMTYNVTYGQGSETLWDFEDGDISAWKGSDDAVEYLYSIGAPTHTSGSYTSPFVNLWETGQFSHSCKTYTHLSSVAEGGKAHSGDKSLAITIDSRNTEFGAWIYSNIYNVQGNTVLRDVANGKNATALGMWVNMPEGFYSVRGSTKNATAMQLILHTSDSADGDITARQIHFTYKGKNINSLTPSDIPENGWIYVTAALPDSNFVKLVDPMLTDVYKAPDFMRMYIKQYDSAANTYYLDDITLDYSAAVEDRNPPEITNPIVSTSETEEEINAQTVTENVLSFRANVADFEAENAEGIDYSSAKMYVDGVEQTGVYAAYSVIGIDDVTLSNGVHNITFEIADNLGNPTTLTKQITVNSASAGSAITINGYNDNGKKVQAGSVYYYDLIANNIEDIQSVTAKITLTSANKWELDHMTTPYGFTAEYTLDPIEPNIATVTVTRTGKSNLTGKQTLVKMPVRVWSYDESTWTCENDKFEEPHQLSASDRWDNVTNGDPVVKVAVNVDYGKIEYTDGSDGTFTGSKSVATAMVGTKKAAAKWHEHNAELQVQNKDATCTEDGYANRTYCTKCGSVVDWGETLKAAGHNYELVNGQFVCSVCEDVYQAGTGLFELDGKTYYAINNVLVSGWQQIDGEYYYFYPETFAGAEGQVTQKSLGVNGNYKYNFTNGKLDAGVWANINGKYRYYYGPDYYRTTWKDVEGARYYFGSDGYRFTGYQPVSPNLNARPPIYELFNFTADGKLIEKITDEGIFDADGILYYIKNGLLTHTGLIKIGDDYYYFNSVGQAAQNETRYVAADLIDPSAAADGLEKGEYTFGPDGKVVKSGIIDGYYYENGAKVHKGLFVYKGDVYYANTEGMIVKDITRYVAADCIDQSAADLGYTKGYYTFGADGKLVKDNGFVDGYYYENGVRVHKGLFVYNGDVYYANTEGMIVKDITRYVAADCIDQSAADLGYTKGYYTFGADGKLVKENGIVDGYYYENGVRVHKGLFVYEGDVYYANTEGMIVTDVTRYVAYDCIDESAAALGYKKGYYEFGADGKLVEKNGLIDGYYYEDGVLVHKGLCVIDGDVYYINTEGKAVTSVTRYVAADCIDASAAALGYKKGYYEFGADGKLANKNGIVDGYYYEDGVCVHKGLFVYNGDVYYANTEGKIVTNVNRYVAADCIDASAAALGYTKGYYTFDADGRMVQQ